MNMATRITEILTAVDGCVRRIEGWMTAKPRKPEIPAEVQAGITELDFIVSTGDLPESCREVATAVARLAEDLRRYTKREYGAIQGDGSPSPAFYASAKSLVAARQGAEAPIRERREPVAILIKQGVSYEQIAWHIYGHRSEGPFVQPNGAPDVALIEQEAATPGSVIPADWLPPWEQDRAGKQKSEMAQRLKAFDTAINGRRIEDPASVEELLRDGAFVQQIERVKGVSRAEVLDVASRCGLVAKDGPGYTPTASDIATSLDASTDDEPPASVSEIEQLVIDAYAASNGEKGAPEIAAELRAAGHAVKSQQVSKILRERATAPAESLAS